MDAKEKTEENGTKKFEQKIGETNRRKYNTSTGGGDNRDYNMHRTRLVTVAFGHEQRELERIMQQVAKPISVGDYRRITNCCPTKGQ